MANSVICIIQARIGSTRFPGKVLKEINGKTIIEILLHRLSFAKKIDKLIVATPETKKNDKLINKIKDLDIDVFRGSETNVLDRYYHAAKKYRPKTIVRITGDCPLIDPVLVDDIIEYYQNNSADYVSNISPPTYPDGLDTEVFSFESLKEAYEKATTPFDKEHVTSFIRNNNKHKKMNYSNKIDLSKDRWTLDDSNDFEVIKNIINYFKPDLDFSWEEIVHLKENQPNLFDFNNKNKRNEGAKLGTGQKLWKRAKNIIPGGNMFLSKRSEMFLPENWPSYYSKARGCEVWDLDNNKYIDMSIMGVGTNILGYANPEVDKEVKKIINKSNMSTLNNPEEVYLSEKLLAMHPWADMVRLARSGGEANSIAIRIARAAVGMEKDAICGYHGWHDWYLSANLQDDTSLNSHLLPGLEPRGVPSQLKNLTLTFNYNDLNSLEQLLLEEDIGVIKMEVSRSVPPNPGFLESVRELATKNNKVLIFDECTSGFRQTFGGLHKKFNVEPDIAVFGKALGNGYPITAIIGKREIMEAAQTTFISSTFWSERIGPVAGLKTLEIMEREKTWETITKYGKQIGERWSEIALKYDLPIEVNGLPSLISFTIPVADWLKYKTLITQQMLKKNFLSSNAVYVCTEHSDEIIDEYFDLIEPIFITISECENGRNIDDLLDGPLCHAGFKRLN